MPDTDPRRESLDHQLRQIERTARVGILRFAVPDGAVWWSEGVPELIGLPAGCAPGWESLARAFGASGVATLRAATAASTRGDQELDIDLPLAAPRDRPAWMRVCGRVATAGAGMQANAIIQDVSERRLIASRISQATAAERQRLLSDLHDNLGQVLAGASLMAAAHERDVRTTAPALAASAHQLVETVTEAQRLCRDLSHELMEDFSAGLADALGRLAARTALTGTGCRLACTGSDAAGLPEVQCRELFRIAQEAVTNALKHAACRNIDIRLHLDARSIDLQVADDGVGIDLDGMVEGLGMRTMGYRAARIGTTVSVAPGAARGTLVRLVVPRV